MPAQFTITYPTPPICRCEHFASIHLEDGACSAENCDCTGINVIPFEQSDLGRFVTEYLQQNPQH